MNHKASDSASPVRRRKILITWQVIVTLLFFLCTGATCSEEKEITLELTVPDPTWMLAIDSVYEVRNELWVIAVVSQNKDMMGAQVISTVQATLKLSIPDLPARYFILGKDWAWENTEPYMFIDNMNQIQKDLKSGELLYKTEKPEEPGSE